MPSIDFIELQEDFPLPYQLIESIPELRKIAENAVNGEWEAPRIKAAIEGSRWWKTKTEKQRQYMVEGIRDPATLKQNINNAKFKVKSLLASMGYGNVADSYLERMAYNMLYEGWDEGRIRYDVGLETANGGFKGMMQSGEAGAFSQEMRTLAYQNGVKITEQWLTNYHSGILKGTATKEQAQRDIRTQAAAKFNGFSEQILAGQNVMDIASPYFQSMGKILEVNTAGMNLFDPTITKALNYKDDKGGTGAKPLWQFENDLRKDQRWLGTQNAQDSMMGTARQVIKDFGLGF